MFREHFKLNSQTLYNLIGKCAKYLQRCLPKKDVQMTLTHVKTWFTLSIIIKPRSRCSGCSKSRAPTAPNTGWDVEQQERPLAAGRGAKRHSHFGSQFSSFLQNKIFSDPVTQSLCSLVILPNEGRTVRPVEECVHNCV